MADIELLSTFLLTSVIFAFLPGPAMLYAAAHVLSSGQKAGLKAVLGIHIGAYLHIIATAAGMTVLLQTVPLFYTVIKICGALYLIWLGARLISNSRTKHQPSRYLSSSPPPDSAHISQSIMVEVLNPKTALFFLAYLPQFADPSASLPFWLQLAILGVIVNCLFTIADLIVVLAAAEVTNRLKRTNFLHRAIHGLGGAILIGMGADLILRKQ